jgi:hypothetical protein
MSELTLFSKGGNTLPAHLRNLQLDATTKSLMGGSNGGASKRISIRGGVFRMLVDGKEIAQNEDRAMNIVIVAANENVSRTYYEGTYEEGKNIAPTCWSNDGIAPDAKSDEPQASKCASCPQNIAGSGQGTSRACRYSQRLAVTLENDMQGDVYQLQLPGQSIFGNAENGKMPLQAYAKFLGGHGIPITAVVTEMRFDTASATPKLTFKAVRPLEPEELENAQEKGQSAEAKVAIASTSSAMDGAKPKAAIAAPAPAPAPVQETPAPKAKAKAAEPEEEAAPEVAEPTKRAKKATPTDVAEVLDDWLD